MADDDEDDVYDEEFDFVDEVDDDEVDDEDDAASELDEGSEVVEEEPREPAEERGRRRGRGAKRESAEETEDEEEDDDAYARPKPEANYVVHIYEYREFKRTIDRPFTGEDAEAFASEYNRTAKPYGRFAVAGKNDVKPRKTLDER